MKRTIFTLTLAMLGVGLAAPASAIEKSVTKVGVVTTPCTSAQPAGQTLCGPRIEIPGRSAFTLVTDVEADVDVYFFTKKNEPTNSFTRPVCDGESGDVSPEAAYAVIVLVEKGCGKPSKASFTFSYRRMPGPACPEVAPNCRPFWARLAAYIVLAILFGPIVGLLLFATYRKNRRRRVRA